MGTQQTDLPPPPDPERNSMVSAPHEAMHRIFQEDPGLFSRLSGVLGLDLPPLGAGKPLTVDLTETEPLERRVDTLLRIETQNDGPFLLIVEAQGKKDPGKTASWPYYVTYLNNKYRIPVLLLVICQDHATAAWAARPLTIGLPQWPTVTTRPLVAGPHNMPVIRNVAEARKDLALATLSAITHADNPDVDAILKTMSVALRDAPDVIVGPFVEFIAQGLGNRPAAQQWRNLVAVDLSFYTSPLSEEIRDEGRVEGRAEGHVERAAEDVLLVLDARGVDITHATRVKVTACGDSDVLRRWLVRAAFVTTSDEIFEEEAPVDR
ncbi:hypothetical protein ABT358_03765 [Streptomyces sp. NPDC000341]|uniref:hypothetical protein n=2 Tax=Streptomyces TaxID=1883 RepID=UPI0029BD5EDD|nr:MULTISPECIES: hypothetical protein [unclassified Streptomyces]MDX3183079.1 hypothetical protein [Streptomyces sp. ME02-7008A-1]MDX3303532.1 hypothetical protein [Streptomyces sp. ME02-7008A]